MSKFYRTRKGHKAHASQYCANARRAIGSGSILEIPAAELSAWAPCLHCCSVEQIEAFAAGTVTEKPAQCANRGVSKPGRIYSRCIDCGKEGKVISSTGQIRAHLPAS